MKKYFFLIINVTVLFTFSCSNSTQKDSDLTLITERIQYDVTIKTPDPDLDWWVMNIEGAKREWFIKTILDQAYEGNVQAYDFLNRPMSAEEVRNIGRRDDTLLMPSMEPPYDDSLVIINERLKTNDITRIRFLEEWHINIQTLSVNKKILGIAPVLEDYTSTGEIRGYRPLFWVYFDEKYPLKD